MSEQKNVFQENEYWRIEGYTDKDGQYFILRRFFNERCVESYSGKADKTLLNVTSVINGFLPPRRLDHLDKLPD